MLIASEASFLFPLQELSFWKVHLQKLTELQLWFFGEKLGNKAEMEEREGTE